MDERVFYFGEGYSNDDTNGSFTGILMLE